VTEIKALDVVLAVVTGAQLEQYASGITVLHAHTELKALRERIVKLEAQLAVAEAWMQHPRTRLGEWLTESPRRRWELTESGDGEMKRVTLRDRRLPPALQLKTVGLGFDEDAAIADALNSLPVTV